MRNDIAKNISARPKLGRALAGLLTGSAPSRDADWEGLIHLARRHAISPNLFHALRSRQETVPAGAWQELRSDYFHAAALALRREHELKLVLGILEGIDAPCVLLKGAAMAHAVYSDPALRTMADLDLWIERSRLASIRTSLVSSGFEIHADAERPLALQDEFTGETRLKRSAPRAPTVELHWNVFAGEWLRQTAHIDEAEIRARCVPIVGLPALRLSTEDALLNACIHEAVNHQLSTNVLRTLLDCELIRRTLPVDWQIIVRRARSWRVATPVWLMLTLLSELFGDETNSLPLSALAPSPLRRRLLRRFVSFEDVGPLRRLSAGPLRFVFLFLLVDRPVAALRLFRRGVFPDRRWLALRYGLQDAPAWRIWLQLLWHPVRTAIRRRI